MTAVILFVANGPLPNNVIVNVVFNIPLLLVFLERPLAHVVRGHTSGVRAKPKVCTIRKFFRVFRALLDCFSGAVSFVHVNTFTIDRTTVVRMMLRLTNTRDKGPG